MKSKGLELIEKMVNEIEMSNKKESKANTDLICEWLKRISEDLHDVNKIPFLQDHFNWIKWKWETKLHNTSLRILTKFDSGSYYKNSTTLEIYYNIGNRRITIIKIVPETNIKNETVMLQISLIGDYEKTYDGSITYEYFLKTICKHIAEQRVKVNAGIRN